MNGFFRNGSPGASLTRYASTVSTLYADMKSTFASGRISRDSLRELAATHQGHHHVRQQQMDRARDSRKTKCHARIHGADDRIPHGPQHVLSDAEDLPVIVDDEISAFEVWDNVRRMKPFTKPACSGSGPS